MTMTRKDQLPPLLLIILIAVFRELCGGHFVSFFLGQILLATPWGTQQQSFLVLQATNALHLIGIPWGALLAYISESPVGVVALIEQ